MGSRYTNEQRKEIIKLHTQEGYSTRLLAVKYSPEAVAKKLMLKEIEMQLTVLKPFQKELERWNVPK